jgi:signal transduction histidine kinase
VGLGAVLSSVGGVALTRPTLRDAVGVATWTVVALALAEVARGRSERFAEMRRAGAEAARARAEQSRRQASEERLRIARELHDVLGHHLSLINMRAGVALHLLDTQPPERAPEQARDAFAAIKQASAEALREVRGVLAALRPADESAPRSPTPGLAELDALVEQARAAGLPVTLRLDGLPAQLPAEVDRAAYRIVQEALTNVRRHAGPSATATVCIGWSPEALAVRVDDDGAGPAATAPAEPGNGIPGMRERAAALGGELSAGGRAGGGFRVDATLPLADHRVVS